MSLQTSAPSVELTAHLGTHAQSLLTPTGEVMTQFQIYGFFTPNASHPTILSQKLPVNCN